MSMKVNSKEKWLDLSFTDLIAFQPATKKQISVWRMIMTQNSINHTRQSWCKMHIATQTEVTGINNLIGAWI